MLKARPQLNLHLEVVKRTIRFRPGMVSIDEVNAAVAIALRRGDIVIFVNKLMTGASVAIGSTAGRPFLRTTSILSGATSVKICQALDLAHIGKDRPAPTYVLHLRKLHRRKSAQLGLDRNESFEPLGDQCPRINAMGTVPWWCPEWCGNREMAHSSGGKSHHQPAVRQDGRRRNAPWRSVSRSRSGCLKIGRPRWAS